MAGALPNGPPRGLVKAVLGPTNTGKTHLAIERMLAHGSGMIGLPLRLLAREIYDRAVKLKGAAHVALITGEEKIAPDTARFFICTVEAMPLDRRVEFLAIDEVQVARDPDRGHIFTDRILNARGLSETMLLGADTMRPMLRRLLPGAEFTRRERLSQLAYDGAKKITKLPKRSALVAFSAEEVYAIAELLRRHRGGAAVVMGALSPRTRNAQVALYQSGEVDFLVATDAIGMGLNMDVDHVAFASRRKFDGHRQRELRPDEIAQIAGRAGRFRTDGTFGETGECAPFEDDIIEAIEAHEFEAVDQVFWRNTHLRFDSVSALIASLEQAPPAGGLTRVRNAPDEAALRALIEIEEIAEKVRNPHAVKRLWEACQLPDFRKASADEHARLIGRMAQHLLKPNGRIPSEWIGREMDALERTEGDLDTLQNRLAQVRTWTYAAQRADWLDDREAWRERAREVEDKLSDALHAALTQRFIDRRTSALLRGLKREDALTASVSSEGDVVVEGHFVGRLDGLTFKPDANALGLEGRAVRNAALRALKPEVSRRLAAISGLEAHAIALDLDGVLRAGGAPMARIATGGAWLAPKLQLIGAESASDTERARALKALEAWLSTRIARDLKPLTGLDQAWRAGVLATSVRGLAFRLLESGGARDLSEEHVEDVCADGAGALTALGFRIGMRSVFAPALLKPRAAHLHAVLRARADGRERSAFLPRAGSLSAPCPEGLDWPWLAAAGYRRCGAYGVRFDQVEKLAAALNEAEAPSEATLSRIIGVRTKDIASVLAGLGYVRDAGEDGAVRWRSPAAKRARRGPKARPDSPFAALASLGPARPRRGGQA